MNFYVTSCLALLFAVTSCNSRNTSSLSEAEILDKVYAEMEAPAYDLSLSKLNADELPDGIAYKGKLLDVHAWVDKNGRNFIIRSSGNEISGNEGASSRFLYAYHIKLNRKREVEVLREINDGVENCDFDLTMGHEINSLKLTDIDKDSLGEISFVYRLNCTSDVSPSNQKLLMIENGDKYILRGHTRIIEGGGEYDVDPSFDMAPEGFLKHAKTHWQEHINEYDFEM